MTDILPEVQEYNDGHAVEGCAYAFSILHQIGGLLEGHPAVIMVGGEQLVQDAISSIYDLYNKIGMLDAMRLDEPS